MDKLKNDINSYDTVFGIREVTRYICLDSIRCVVIASNADEPIKKKLISMCESKKVPYRFVPSKEEMGKIANLERPCTVTGFFKEKPRTH